MTIGHLDTRGRQTALADALRRAGAIRSGRWADVFARTPRHVCVPRLFEQGVDERGMAVWRPVDASETDRWLDLVYSDESLVTGLDPATVAAADGGGFTGVATSSSSLPSLMAGMLETLDLHDGDDVLEIGTGTGYNAALLCGYLGDAHVTSIDVDPELVALAASRLARLGYRPRLATANGLAGYPDRAPYDRIIVTCSVSAVPVAWIEQTRAGGLILTDIAGGIEGGLVRLTVSSGQAEGRFTATTGRFMAARSDAQTYPVRQRVPYASEGGTRDTTVSAGDIREHYPYRLLLDLRLPGVELVYQVDDDGTIALQLQDADGSWARTPLPGRPDAGTLTWGGNPALWQEVELMWEWWLGHGRPDQTQFGVTATRTGTHPWWQRTNDARRVMVADI